MRSYLRHASRENTRHPVDQSLTQSICGHHLVTWLTFQRVSANRTITATTIDAGLEHLRRCRSKHYDSTLMIEIARQFATASCLLQFSMESDRQFLTCNIEMDKHDDVVAGELLTAQCTSLVRNYRPDNQPDYLSIDIRFSQLGKPVCDVRFTLVPQAETTMPQAETTVPQADPTTRQAQPAQQEINVPLQPAAQAPQPTKPARPPARQPLFNRLWKLPGLTLHRA